MDMKIPRHLLGQETPASPDPADLRRRAASELPEPAGLGLSPEEAQIFRQLNGKRAGRKAGKPPLEARIVRELKPADLALLEESRVDGRHKAGTVQLQRVRSIHHQMAQYLVQGYRPIEVAALLGVSQHRIALLQGDPAFREIMEYYAERQKNLGVSIMERLQTLAVLGLEEIQERLLDEPELLSNGQLMKLIETTLDRSGHAPGGTSGKAQAELPADDVARLKAEVRQASKTKVVARGSAEAAEYIPRPQPTSGDGGPDGEGS